MFVTIERRGMAVAIFALKHDEQNKDGGRRSTQFDSHKHFVPVRRGTGEVVYLLFDDIFQNHV